MIGTIYTRYATQPKEIVKCMALSAGSYPVGYAEKIDRILTNVESDIVKRRVRKTLGSFEVSKEGNLVSSNPYKLVILEQLFYNGKVLASRPNLQVAREKDYNFMRGFYVDCGLNLVPYKNGGGNDVINPVQAKELEQDLEKVGIDLTSAKLIPYHILACRVSRESLTGLVFRLSEKGRDISKKVILNTEDFRWDYKPAKNQSGLFGVCLDANGDWDCDNRDLVFSDVAGGVVVENTIALARKV